jgi:hypothetical protein
LGSHLELAIIRSIEGILRLANGGDTLVDAGFAAVALLGDFTGSRLELAIIRSIAGILRLANGGDTLVDAGSAAVALLGGNATVSRTFSGRLPRFVRNDRLMIFSVASVLQSCNNLFF